MNEKVDDDQGRLYYRRTANATTIAVHSPAPGSLPRNTAQGRSKYLRCKTIDR